MNTIKLPIVELPIKKIVPVGNARHIDKDDPDIQALAQSMQENGQEIEVRVFQENGTYTLKSGYRRLLAAQLLGWDTIRAVIEPAPLDETEFLIRQAIENDQRQPLTYTQKAHVFHLLKTLGLNQSEIAVKFGISPAQVSLMLALLRAIPKLQEAVDSGKISPSAVEPLLFQPVEVQEKLADAALHVKTVAKVGTLVQTYKRGKDIADTIGGGRSAPVSEDIDPLEEMALNELREAVVHLSIVTQAPLQHPALVRPVVEELLRLASGILKQLEG